MLRPRPRSLFRGKFVLPLCLALAAALAVSSALAAGSRRRDPSIAVRFHAQVNTYDSTFAAKVSIGNPPREVIVEKIPSISERDIASFYPYRANDGSFSAVIQLDPHGRATLEAVSNEKRGQFFLVAINGRPVTLLTIDKPIKDGIIFIPNGFSEMEIRAMGESFEILGQEGGVKKHPRKPEDADTGTGLPKPVL